jgi:hypothetical protein
LAISGIAARFAKRVKDDYLAGLWRSRFLLGQILWTVAYVGSRQLRPSKYQGPSWSWADINSPITLHSRSEQLHKNFKIIKCRVELLSKGTIIDIDPPNMELLPREHWKCKAFFRPAKLVPDQSKWDKFQTSVLKVQNFERLDKVLAEQVNADAIDDEFNSGGSDSVAVSLLVITTADDPVGQYLSGLVLRRKGNSQYSRLGVFKTHETYSDRRPDEDVDSREQRYGRQMQWFQDDDPQVLTIE